MLSKPNASFKFNNVANTTNTTPKFISNKGTGNKIINDRNILTRVRLKPLTHGNIGIFASAYSNCTFNS